MAGEAKQCSQLEAGHQLGNQESQVLVPAPPQTCWVSLGDQFPSLCLIYRKGGPGDLRRMLTCKILGIRSQDFHTGQEKAEGGQNWKAVQRGHTSTLLEERIRERAIPAIGGLESSETSGSIVNQPTCLPTHSPGGPGKFSHKK